MFRDVAINAQNGGHETTTVRRYRFFVQLLIDGAEAIGPTGVLIIGVLGISFFLFKTVKSIAKPANEVVFVTN